MSQAIQDIQVDMKIKLTVGGEAPTSATTRTKHRPPNYRHPSNTIRCQILMVLLHLRQHIGAIMQARLALHNHHISNMRIPSSTWYEMFLMEHRSKMAFAILCPHIANPPPIRHTALRITKTVKHPTQKTIHTTNQLRRPILTTV